jgi:hypothetical protein
LVGRLLSGELRRGGVSFLPFGAERGLFDRLGPVEDMLMKKICRPLP